MEIQLYDRMTDPASDLPRYGEYISTSGMFGCEKREQAIILAWECLAQRKSPFEILSKFHIVSGRLSKRADAMLADFMKSGGKVKWKQFDTKAAIALWSFADNVNLEIGYTIEEATAAGLTTGKNPNWKTRPDAMLRARCISKAVRMLNPEVCAGFYTPEEAEDFGATEPKANPLTEKAAKVETVVTVGPAKATVEAKPIEVVPMPIEPVAKIEAPTAQSLPAELFNRICEAIPATHQDRAIAYLKGKNKINNGLADLKPDFAEKILKNSAAFLKEIENVKVEAK